MPTTIDDREVDKILEFAQRFDRTNPNYQHLLERRIEKRRRLVIPAVLQPASPEVAVLGEAFDVVTRDFSLSGIGLVTGQMLKHNHYTIRLTVDGEEVYVLGHKTWCIPRAPYFLAGLNIVRHLRPG